LSGAKVVRSRRRRAQPQRSRFMMLLWQEKLVVYPAIQWEARPLTL